MGAFLKSSSTALICAHLSAHHDHQVLDCFIRVIHIMCGGCSIRVFGGNVDNDIK